MAPEKPLVQEIPFHIQVPAKVWEKSGEDGKQRRIGGIISTEHRDKQGEVVLQRGLDFTNFLGKEGGWINDNHSKETDDIVGYPISIKRTHHRGKPATYMEGYLLPEYKKSDKIWNLAQSLQKTDRRLGFSIEGKVKQRTGTDGKTIAAAQVTNVAVTNCPVNAVTGLEVLAKSMKAMEHHASGRSSSCEECEARDIHAALERGDYAEKGCGKGCKDCKCGDEADKSLSAGAAVDAPAAATAGDGFALRTESLEGSPTDTAGKARKKRKRKRLSKAEALEVINVRYPGLPPRAAERIWQYAKQQGA